jgi:hypothetical protein
MCDNSYLVVRIDDNGNEFTLAQGLVYAEALQLMRKMTLRGHKQTYVIVEQTQEVQLP